MKVTRQEHLTMYFVLEFEDLERISLAFGDFVGPTTFKAECADKLTREFDSLEQLLAFENPSRKRIVRLRLGRWSPDLKTYGSLSLDGDSRLNVLISLEGEEDKAMLFSERLVDALSAARPWYSIFRRADSFWILLLLYWGFLGGAYVAGKRPFPDLSHMQPFDLGPWGSAIASGALIGAIFLVIGTFANRLKLRMFPSAVFAIGQGRREHRNMETLRTGVVLALLVSILGSAIWAALSAA